MNIKKKALYISASAVLVTALSASVAFAATVPSDYARDISDGQAQAQSYADIAAYEKEVTDNEDSSQAQVDDGQVKVDQTVGTQEGQMDDKDSGEMQPTSSTTDANSPMPATVNSTQSSGGTNQ
jgi:cell fate (sporulation/competence/biofilm development) regulator YlbF (YheA/YmcA/DUF963 family)